MHVPGRDWAKVVICFVDGAPVQAVVPAPLAVNFERLLDLARGHEIRLAREDVSLDATTLRDKAVVALGGVAYRDMAAGAERAMPS